MKQLETMRLLCKTLYLLLQMPAGEGWIRPTAIKHYSGQSHSTTYRYLLKLFVLGFVETRNYKSRNLDCKEYRITDKGVAYLEGFTVMI